MNKKRILLSLLTIVAVVGVAFGATRAYFFDEEKSVGNVLGAGTIDIIVDGVNPWELHSEPFELKDMKPSYTKYIKFTVKNLVDSNPINLWKRINITDQSDEVISEPECTEGGGSWTGGGTPCTDAAICCTGNYVPRNNLAAYILYDMYVCASPSQGGCETDTDSKPVTLSNWTPIITETENQHVRLDNIDGIWIALGKLEPTDELKVVQSYHLSSWPDAPEPEVTNWAQGDKLTFDIELMATQLNGPGPLGEQATLNMIGKNPTTWVEIAGASGTLGYNTSGETFDYDFNGTGLQNIQYCLIYYADPWPGDHPGALIDQGLASGSALTLSGSHNFGYDLPHTGDANHPAGAKIWLVPCADYDETGEKMNSWSPSTYLFEENLITYEDTDS